MCGKGGAKRSVGCGTVGYGGKVWEAEGWKGHKRDCGRGYKLEKKEVMIKGADLPYETI